MCHYVRLLHAELRVHPGKKVSKRTGMKKHGNEETIIEMKRKLEVKLTRSTGRAVFGGGGGQAGRGSGHA
jgi:hypothetical protein